MNTYKDLIVWQKAMELATETYRLTEKFPQGERFGLISQMRRCAVSIPSNIAEGKLRLSQKEFKRFLAISFGSGAELETQVAISKKVLRLNPSEYSQIDKLLNEVMRIINSFLR